MCVCMCVGKDCALGRSELSLSVCVTAGVGCALIQVEL